MYCPNCGTNLPEGTKFCSSCGTKVEAAAPEVKEAAPEVKEAPVESAQPVETAAPVSQESEMVRPRKKLDMKKLIIAGVAAAVVVVIAVIALVIALSGGSKDAAYVYMSDGSYQLLTDLKKGEPIEIASLRSDIDEEYRYGSLVRFSPDGKYVYYYTKVDEDAGTGSLNRAEFGKLKEDSKKNDKYIDVIATNVQLGFRFFNDGTLTYRNGDDALYYYNGENTSSVAKKVNNYYIDAENGRIVYTVSDDDESSQILYGILTGDLNNKIKLASNVDSVYYPDDFNSIFYTKVDEEYVQSLYVVGFEKEAEKVGDELHVISVDGDSVCFMENEGKTVSLYDYVTDSKMTADAGVTEPVRDDFAIPRYDYYMIYDYDLAESNYTDLYTSCTENLYWYGMSTWRSYSMEEALYVNWTENSDQIHAATQEFIDKFADRANEDGYIPVTADVKAALQKIDSCSSGETANSWLWLCYSKEQNGYTYDYDAYYAACDAYEEAEDRIELREALKQPEYAYNLHSLYVYSQGTKTLICDNLMDYEWMDGGILYNTTDLMTEKVDMEEVHGTYDVERTFYIDYEDQNYVLPFGSTSAYQMSEEAAFTFSEAYESSYAELTVTDNAVYMQEDNGALSVAAVTDGLVGDFSIITDDGHLIRMQGDKIYYINDTYDNNEVTYGDLYSYAEGEGTLLARDVVVSHYDYYDGYYVDGVRINSYEDGVILAYTDYSRYGYELTMFNKKGEAEVVAEDVTSYVRIDASTLLLISDGDLYCYNGKEKTKLASDVDYLWCTDSMNATVLYWY